MNQKIIMFIVGFLALVVGASAYTTQGNTVFLNDSRAYLGVTPHTITHQNDAITLELLSKTYSGDVNLVFGFDSASLLPRNVYYDSPALVEVEHSYKCYGDFGYSTNPFYGWCFDENGSVIFNHSFTRANAGTATIWWNETESRGWTLINDLFTKVDYTLDGKDTWYYATGLNVNAGQTYMLRYYLSIREGGSYKYDVGVYPSSYGADIMQAYQDGNLMFIDPWVNDYWQNVFFDDFDNNDYAGDGWTVVDGGWSEAGTTIIGTQPDHNAIYQAEFSNLTWYDESWRIDYTGEQDTAGTYYHGIMLTDNGGWLPGSGILITDDPHDTGESWIYCYGDCTCGDNSDPADGGINNHETQIIFNSTNHTLTLQTSGVEVMSVQVTGCNMSGYRLALHARKNVENFNWINVSKYVEPVGAGPTINITGLFLQNLTYGNESNISEREQFYVGANVTYDNGTAYPAANCTWWSQNISYHTGRILGTNYTLVDNTDKLWLNVSEGNDSARQDSYKIQVCRLNTPTPLDIYVNGVLNRSIGPTLIPLCSNGFREDIYTTTEFLPLSSINISFQCDDCNGLGKQLKIVMDAEQELAEFDREFNNHTEDMDYQAGEGIYSYRSHTYMYAHPTAPGAYNISITCNATSELFDVVVWPVGLTIKIISINGTAYTPNMSVTNSSPIHILTDIYGDAVTYSEINVTYYNGTRVENQTNYESIQLNNLTWAGVYNISIKANDDEGNSFYQEGYFYLLETPAVPPTMASAGIECNLSASPYRRSTIDAVCRLNTSSTWYCYGLTFWNNTPTELVGISPPRQYVDGVGVVDYVKVVGTSFTMKFSTTDIYPKWDYNFTVICVDALGNTTGSFGSIVNPEIPEPRSIVYRLVWVKSNMAFIVIWITIIALLILIGMVIYNRVRK